VLAFVAAMGQTAQTHRDCGKLWHAHKKGLKTEVLKPLMSALSREAEPEVL
jgi:hypothetical protein